MKKTTINYLDQEEKDLVESIEKINPKKLKRPSLTRIRELKKGAGSFLKNETKMNIRIDPLELEKLKKRAQKEGLKYSTFVKSVLHKFLTGQLVEKNN